jgi:hypothetical protein
MSAVETARPLANPNTRLASLKLKNQWTRWEGSLPVAGRLSSDTCYLAGGGWAIGLNITPVVPNVVAEWLGGN